MGKAVFAFDPIIGCPFDDSELVMVERHDGRSVGERVSFKGPNKLGTRVHPVRSGKIVAIGANAKYADGKRFTAFAVQSAGGIRLMTEKEFLPGLKYAIVKGDFAIMPRDIPAISNTSGMRSTTPRPKSRPHISSASARPSAAGNRSRTSRSTRTTRPFAARRATRSPSTDWSNPTGTTAAPANVGSKAAAGSF
jgi:hypothetical protein